MGAGAFYGPMLDMRIKELGMTGFMRWLAVLLGLGYGGLVFAQAPAIAGIVVTESSGTLRYRIGDSEPQTAVKGQVIPVGARITTGAGANAVLTFPDGMVVGLGEQSRLRVLDYRYVANDIEKSRVVINLTEGSVRIALGTIGQRDPGLIQLQVGEGGLAQALGSARSGEISLTVRGIATMLQVGQGKVLLNVAGQSYPLGAGQTALVQESGFVQVSGVADAANRSEDDKLMQERLEKIRGAPFAPGNRPTVITLSTPFGVDLAEDLPPFTSATGAVNGAGGSVSPN